MPSSELAWRIERDDKLRAATDKRRTACIEWASRRGLDLSTVQQIYVFLLGLIAKECVLAPGLTCPTTGPACATWHRGRVTGGAHVLHTLWCVRLCGRVHVQPRCSGPG